MKRQPRGAFFFVWLLALGHIGVPLFLVRFRTFQKPLSMRVSRAWHLATRMDAGFSDPLQFLFSS